MKFFLVAANPNPASFTHRMVDRAVSIITAQGHEVWVSDLYADGFNPVSSRDDFLTVACEERFDYQLEQRHAHRHQSFAADVQREQQRLQEADGIILVFPLWWSGVPAIMKGWFDRVLAAGFAYEDGRRYDTGHFPGKTGMLGIVTGGTASRFAEGAQHGSMHQQIIWSVQHGVLEYLGLEAAEPFIAYAGARADADRQEEYLTAWEQRVAELVSLTARADATTAAG